MFKYRFCVWLVDTLLRSNLTYSEIEDEWLVSSVNESAKRLEERSFRRHCRDAEKMFGVEIKCDRSDGFRYKIVERTSSLQDNVRDWLLSTFRISNLARYASSHKSIVLEPAPPAAHLLQTVIEAIDKGRLLAYKYKSNYDEEFTYMEVVPAFVKLFKQRWYLVGERLIGDEKEGEVVITALVKTRDMVMLDRKGRLSEKCKELEDPQEFFSECYGILRDDYQPPQRIVVRAFWPQDRYIRQVPIHHSQVEIKTTEDYADFELYVRTTYDFKQELMWQRDKMAVIYPESFKQTMIEVLEATLRGYRTGESHAIDE